MSSEAALDIAEFEEPAKALVRGEWRAAAGLLVQIAATAATGNPFVGIAAGASAEWLWATAAASTATAKLQQAEADLAKLDDDKRVAFIQNCLRGGFAGLTASDAPQGRVPSNAKELGELLEQSLGQVLRSLALLHSKVDAIADSLGPSLSRVEQHLRAATTHWFEEIDGTIAGTLSLPRTELRAKLDAALATSRGVVILGESGAGKSALAKAALHARPNVCAVHALELKGLLDRIDIKILAERVKQHLQAA